MTDHATHAGLADPVYAEAYVTVHQYDIVLDVTVINRTSETLQNLCLELATMGDLKLVERPQNYTLSPQSSKIIRCSPTLFTFIHLGRPQLRSHHSSQGS